MQLVFQIKFTDFKIVYNSNDISYYRDIA